MSENNKPNMTAAAGIAGVVIGAGVTAAAVALSDKKNREKVIQTVDGLRKHAGDMISSVKAEIDEGEEKIDESLSEGKRAIDDIKEPSSKTDERILKTV